MAEGIRIRHFKHRSTIVVIRDRARPFDTPTDCHLCGVHVCKTYHFDLDAEGSVIVSTGVWAALRGMADHYDRDTGTFYPNAGFDIANKVPEPPTQRLVVAPIGSPARAHAPGRVDTRETIHQ